VSDSIIEDISKRIKYRRNELGLSFQDIITVQKKHLRL